MSKIAVVLKNSPLSVDEIASKARLTSDRVRELIAGRDATLADIRALARALKVPIRTFASERAATSDVRMLFRSSTSAVSDRGVEAAAQFVQSALDILPRRNAAPEWLSEFRFASESYLEAARLADQFRLRFLPDRPNDPLIDLPEIVTQRADVILGRLETSKFEGASVVADGYPFIFVSARFSGRMLFTLAHEIGHLVSHHNDSRYAVFDRASQIGDGRRHQNRSESFVNAFASVLLMPAAGVGMALQQIRSIFRIQAEAIGDVELLYLARFFGVSFDVAARRCEDLELLPSGGAKSLSDFLREQHGGPEKRAAALNLPPRSEVRIPRVSKNLLQVACQKVKDGAVSVGWVSEQFGCSISDVYNAHVTSEVSRGPHH